MNTFRYSLLSCPSTENAAMAMFCTPCLYGINKSKVEALDGIPNPSIIPGTLTYMCVNVGTQLLGGIYGIAAFHAYGLTPTPEIIQGISGLCGMICTGVYAGKLRSRIREKYNIRGDEGQDCIIHTLASPCALCQEANEIHHRALSNEVSFYSPMDAPSAESMKM